MKTAWALAAALLLFPAVGGIAHAEGDCIPAAVLRAIDHAERVRIVQVGQEAERRRGPHDDAPGEFMGFARLENFEIGGRAGGWLTHALARRDRYRCEGSGPDLDFGEGERGLIGVEFDTPSGPVRVLVGLPYGQATVGFASGVRYPAALSEAAHRDWRRFLDEYTRERRSDPGEYLRALLERQRPTSPADAGRSPDGTRVDAGAEPESADAGAAADCRLPAFGEPNDVSLAPVAITRVAPDYPDIARESGVSGTVRLHVLVDCVGAVRQTRTAKSIPMLDAAAVAAVRQWRFEPAVRSGRPVACWTEVPVKFSLH